MQLSPKQLSRLYAKIAIDPTGCWLWIDALAGKGYASITIKRKCYLAHRVMYELNCKPIPIGYQIDHTCAIKRCVNPAHLKAVTARDNMLADHTDTLPKRNTLKTHCVHGHPFNYTNTYHYMGERVCRTCQRERQRRYAQKKEDALVDETVLQYLNS